MPYISDYHGISVVGSASLSGALLGMDHFHLSAFVADVVLYLVVALLGATTVRSVRARSASVGLDGR